MGSEYVFALNSSMDVNGCENCLMEDHATESCPYADLQDIHPTANIARERARNKPIRGIHRTGGVRVIMPDGDNGKNRAQLQWLDRRVRFVGLSLDALDELISDLQEARIAARVIEFNNNRSGG